ncbi:MAG: hypothetical protein QM790_17440 [Nibricoccus sp.]
MTAKNLSVISALLAAALTAGTFYYRHHQQAREVGRLRYENNRLLHQAYLHHASTPAPSALAPENTTPAPATTPNSVPAKLIENYRDEGQATPLAALQTFAWACDRGDTQRVAQMLMFDPSARTKAEAFLAGLPEDTRSRWKSVDEMASTELTFAIMQSPFPNADVLDAARFEAVSDERTQFRLPGTRRDRSTFQKSDGLWKYVITEAMVDAYIRNASSRR